MKAREGDLVIVHGSHVGRPRRTGRIAEVLIGAGPEHYRVRWDTGDETIYFPQSDCTIIPAGQWEHPGRRDHRETGDASGTRSQIDTRGSEGVGRGHDDRPLTVTEGSVQLTFEEDATHTDARLTIVLNGFEFTGFGRARRNPRDPDNPAIGEELAAARAMADLSHQLLDLATYQIEVREGHPVHVHL